MTDQVHIRVTKVQIFELFPMVRRPTSKLLFSPQGCSHDRD